MTGHTVLRTSRWRSVRARLSAGRFLAEMGYPRGVVVEAMDDERIPSLDIGPSRL
jgi:hypothetical protein